MLEFKVDKEKILSEVNDLNTLLSNYKSAVDHSFQNSSESISAYHSWYDRTVVVFGRYFEASDHFKNLLSVNNDVNGYGLACNYNEIRGDYCIMLDMLERMCENDISEEPNDVTSNENNVGRIKVFISHSSKDKEIIDEFVDKLLLLGIGVPSDAIAYTSRDSSGVEPGKSIPDFIKDNIGSAEIVLLMISDNYRRSEVCLNEMGAAWALNKRIIQILLPNASFDKIGWLCSLDKAISISDASALDSFFDVVRNTLALSSNVSEWNRNKMNFIGFINSLDDVKEDNLLLPVVRENVEDGDTDELGLLDYKLIMEDNIYSFSMDLGVISESINSMNNQMISKSSQLRKICVENPGSTKQAIQIIKTIAVSIDKASEAIESRLDTIQSSYVQALDACKKIRTMTPSDDIDNDIASVRLLLDSMNNCKANSIEMIEQFGSIPDIERSFMKAKKRFVSCVSKMNGIIDDCSAKSKELIQIIL